MSRLELPRRRAVEDAGRLTAYISADTVRDYKWLKEVGIDAGKLVRDAIERVIRDAKEQVSAESA